METLEQLLKQLDISKVDEAGSITEYRLNGNGLRVLLSRNASAPVVTFMVLFRIGSRNEAVGYTGATHFLEHMMFKGTSERNPDKNNGIDDLLKPIGALYNATTWFDRTNYFECVSSKHLELCVEIEADRMRNLVLRQEDRDSEMTVVRNELERGENEPDDVLMDNLYALAFREHPYHHPTIGWRTDVEGVPMDRLREFYNTFYWPNNACAIVVGDFDHAEALKLIHKNFGKIPKSPAPIPDVYTVEPPQQGERRFEIRRAGDLPRVMIGYHVPEAAHADTYALSAMESVLGGSGRRSSRLYKRLIDSGLASDCSAWHNQQHDPGMFIFSATVNPDIDPKSVEEAMLDEISKLGAAPPNADELQRAKSANRKSTILAAADPMTLARQIGESEAVVDWRWYVTYDDNFDAVSESDVQRVARTYFSRDNRTVGYFIPKTEEELAAEASVGASHGSPAAGIAGSAKKVGGPLQVKPDTNGGEGHKASSVAGSSSKSGEACLAPTSVGGTSGLLQESGKRKPFAEQVVIKKLKNGMTVMYMPNRNTGSVSIVGKLRAGYYFADDTKSLIPSVISDMVTRGSKKFSKTDIAEILENMGASLAFRADNFAINFGSQVVTSDLPELLGVLSDILINPTFAKDELEKCQTEFVSYITEKMTNTGSRARNQILQALYPPESVYYARPFEMQIEEIKDMTDGDLCDYHKKLFSPQGLILSVVGDIDEAQAFELVEKAFGDWAGPAPKEIDVPAVARPLTSARVDVPIPDKANVDIVIGHPVELRRIHPDFFAALLANAALGKDTLSSRLGVAVREKAGLTYGIYSGFDDVGFGSAPWMITLSVNPDNIDRALGLISNVVDDYVSGGITDKELEDEKGRTEGQFLVGLRTSYAIASTLAQYQFIGLDPADLDGFPEKVRAVTKEQVNEAIKKYLQINKATTVIAGTFPKK